MILTSVYEALPDSNMPLRVTISVADGERLAQKTLNPRLGIVGGLSILGTTGIVVPYSTSAFRICISQALDVAVAAGCNEVALTTGARSERFAQALLQLPDEAFIQMGDFVGYALRACARGPWRTVTIAGLIGKLSKMAAGHRQTHAAKSQIDLDFLASLARGAGASTSLLAELAGANTARHWLDLAQSAGIESIPKRVCQIVCQRMRQLLRKEQVSQCIMTDFDGRLLARESIG
jgi:cobalt-precorrin-5B (C1)-methyltransferase